VEKRFIAAKSTFSNGFTVCLKQDSITAAAEAVIDSNIYRSAGSAAPPKNRVF
jgi:hypothetical protein